MNGEKNTAVIGAGSNIDPEANVRKAKEALTGISVILNESEFIYTKPLLYPDQPDFLNGAWLISTGLDLCGLKERLTAIERLLGRVRNPDNPNGPRTIDLDILIFNETVIDTDVYKRDFLRRFIAALLPEIELPPWD